MKRNPLIALLLLGIGTFGIVGLTAWNYFQARRSVIQSNERWVHRVSEMIVTERLSYVQWLDQFPDNGIDMLPMIANSNPRLSALFLIDTRLHITHPWIRPSLESRIGPLDSRLVVLSLKVLETHLTTMGPVVLIDGIPHGTVVRPLGSHEVLIALIRAQGIPELLEQEARFWGLNCFVYDYEQHPIFAWGNPSAIHPILDATIQQVRSGSRFGLLHLARPYAWQWVASYHYDPASDWIFIVEQSATVNFLPLFLFVISMTGVLILARAPWRAMDDLRLQRWSSELSTFAYRVDNYIRGRDVVLNEPPYPFKELMPIVLSLRWLMPQWKKAEAFPRELALERSLLTLLIESLPEGILFFNAQGGLQMSNELGRVFLALQQEAGHESKMLSGVQIPRGFLEPFLEPVFTGQQRNVGKEVEVSWADGKHLYRVWVEAVETTEGHIDGFIVVVRDITFRKQWEYVQEQVLSGITHDLRGPLSAVMGYLDLLRRQLKEGPPKAVEYVGLAREAGVRLTQMVSDILDVVRFEQGKIDLQPEAIPVGETFKRLNSIFSVTANQKQVTLKLNPDVDADASVWGDPKLLERVLDNLVGNAIKFTPSGGTITVSVQHGAQRMMFQVSDTGRGIPKEAQSRIFDKFQQVRPGDRSSGYGLGLAVAKFIVEAHKGEIRVESEVGQGSTFSFWIPDQPSITAMGTGASSDDAQASEAV